MNTSAVKPVTTLKLLSLSILLLSGCKATEAPSGTQPENTHNHNIFATTDDWYVDEEWSANAKQDGGEAIAHHSTGIWLNSLGDIGPVPTDLSPDGFRVFPTESPRSLEDHLKDAEQQNNALVLLVLNNLPGAQCNAYVNKSFMYAKPEAFLVYQKYFIDPIVATLQKYPHLPVAVVVEPDSLFSIPNYHYKELCQTVSNKNWYGYTNAIRYAINQLSTLPNVHPYLDIRAGSAHNPLGSIPLTSLYAHGIINGFTDAVEEKARELSDAVEASDGATGLYLDLSQFYVEPPQPPDQAPIRPPGYHRIDGFISNLADYVPLDEPWLGDPLEPEGASPLRSAYFYDWNPIIDEHTYGKSWLDAIQEHSQENLDHLGILIDTSRNGWGQNQARLAPLDVVNQDPDLVDEYRVDGREHRSNWCNQVAGLGLRPQLAKADRPWIHAYVWGKQPGISDGTSLPDFAIDNTEKSRKFDPSCDPDQLSIKAEQAESTDYLDLGTGAMEDAPAKGRWFSAGFSTLMENAWPPICEGKKDRCD